MNIKAIREKNNGNFQWTSKFCSKLTTITLLEMNIEILQLICLEYILNLSQINLPPISRKSKFCSNDGLNSSQNKDENYFGMSTKILFKLSVKILSKMNINFLIEMNFKSLPEMISDFLEINKKISSKSSANSRKNPANLQNKTPAISRKSSHNSSLAED